jgi:Tfp pilus assembly protein PilE
VTDNRTGGVGLLAVLVVALVVVLAALALMLHDTASSAESPSREAEVRAALHAANMPHVERVYADSRGHVVIRLSETSEEIANDSTVRLSGDFRNPAVRIADVYIQLVIRDFRWARQVKVEDSTGHLIDGGAA